MEQKATVTTYGAAEARTARRTEALLKEFARNTTERLEKEIDTALHRRYGKNPNPAILCRVQQEWRAMQERECVLDVAALWETAQWLRTSGQPYWMGSFAGANLLLYLLGITNTNPLPPHLYCPKCHRVIWKEEYKDGFDKIEINVSHFISLHHRCFDGVIIPFLESL